MRPSIALPSYGDYYDEGERVELAHSLHAVVKIHYDQDHGAPWDEEDGHGPVSDWTSRDKAPGERVLSEDRSRKRYYDFAEAVRIAKRDGWGAPAFSEDPAGRKSIRAGFKTKAAAAAAAAEADFERLRAWCNDEWHYIGVAVTLFDEDENELSSDSLWGIESDGDYWREVATEMLIDLYDTEIESRVKAKRAERHEAREVKYWAERDVDTKLTCSRA